MPALKSALNKAAKAVSSALPTSSSAASPSSLTTASAPTPAASLAASKKDSSAPPVDQVKKDLVVYAVTLENDGSPAKGKTLLRLPPPTNPYVLRITVDAGTAASRNGVLQTNFPLNGGKFKRDQFASVKLPQDFSKPFEIDLPITTAGAFSYYVEYDSASNGRTRSEPGYFVVDPVLRIPSRSPILDPETHAVLPVGKGGVVSSSSSSTEVALPLDGLVIQTVIAKWMGTLPEWEPHLDVMSQRGYNMIHYTPLQQRGESNSPYSIFDQLEMSDDLFDAATVAKGKEAKNAAIKTLLARIRKEWGMLGMMDVVLNHTANNSKWLEEHPEAGYSVHSSPHLAGALELDDALLDLSRNLASLGLPTTLNTDADLDAIMSHIEHKVLPSLKLYEFYALDVAGQKALFRDAWTASAADKGATTAPPQGRGTDLTSLSIEARAARFAETCLPDNWSHLGQRFHAQLDLKRAVAFIAEHLAIAPGSDSATDLAADEVARLLDVLNVDRYKQFDDDTKAILDNTKNRVKYTRIDEHGPRMGPITDKSPLIESLFTRLPKNSTTAKHDPSLLALANNGWIWDADPLLDFASPASRTYIRRDLIVWGDCVKLRYGTGRDDNPWLWDHMAHYVEQLAAMFDGFRLDNSHSTPIHVGEYLMDKAREVNPNLYVCAELFTGRQELDLLWVCRLGINSLIREAYNANSPKEESGLLYGFGLGKPIGSMDTDCLSERTAVSFEGVTRDAKLIPHPGSVPHAFLMDITHDNESPLSKRTAEDALPTGALVTFARAAVGSNRGFDDLYPKLLDVVSETRKYEVVKATDALGEVKRLLNHLHTELVLDEGVEGHFSQEGEYVTAHRVNPVTHRGYLLVARTAFSSSSDKSKGDAPTMRLDGTRAKFIAGASVSINSTASRDTDSTLRGLDASVSPITAVEPELETDSSSGLTYSTIVVPDEFPRGSILVFSTWMDDLPTDLDDICASGAKEAFKDLTMVELNVLMYRCDGEERDATGGDGCFNLPDSGPLLYCGLQGWMPHLRHIMENNDLGHPLCANLRNGTWALDYVVNRLEKQVDTFPALASAAAWFRKRFDLIRAHVPPFLRPKYFAFVINVAFKAARDQAVDQCSPLVRQGTSFVHQLALVSVQMYGQVSSASLDAKKTVPSLAAGLPHFTTGWARTWGRDVFISLRGLFLVTGQYAAARDHILAFSTVLKHGLIPNLLDSGRTPRYNSRDSPWFMLQNIQDYVNTVPSGLDILKDTVQRRFPLDDTWVPYDDERAYATTSSVADVIQEILQRHASGIHFREYNAGPNLDMQMSDLGFNIDIEVDWKTGIIYGGNEHNCGTWQDKMGESQKAGNQGKPGTPRDGAPVEITGLHKSAVRWLAKLSSEGKFPHKGVTATIDGKERFVSYQEWDQLLQDSFERLYYVPADPSLDAKYDIDPSLVARRGIYKDVHGTPAPRARADYQLRGQFPIAMAVAPELFTPKFALDALATLEANLVGPLGVKTLDAADPDYRGVYDNSNDSDDYAIAKGRNYHQGPEWVWPMGYFLRAHLIFDTLVGAGKDDLTSTFHHIYEHLSRHRAHISADPWAGLPELTNENGGYCHDSCRTQAWSASTLLDALDDMAQLAQAKAQKA
ncbi:glycoside hydrolase family 13 protein [Rhodotorula graminis WP1]|uniref:Glycogen debranching enzyme n=1 Tax=Rhodotorula graminis (strain WP1) TaxID=578459 RepID=A0A194SBG9_RHOGW|nr:glycoside hydrolase family 13 protein [Rhodotorula graminis WP1]KPV77934.1 glycoside hydrolase family 13 protein [Rhodotorula graminis WP1]